MKSWVSSAFSDDKPPPSSSSSSSQATGIRAPLKTTTSTSLNSIEVISSSKPPMTKIPSTRAKLATVMKPETTAKRHQAPVSSVSLSDKYEPAQRADLVVNKSKIEQLSSALDSMMTKRVGSIMIIEGPPGCGKSVRLLELCSALDRSGEMIFYFFVT